MLKIRLMRIGTNKQPFYRVVVVNGRSKRTGAYVELLGTYNPLTEPKDIKLKQDRIDHWIKQGAQPSTGYLRMLGKAPQRPPRKPKKEKKESSAASPQSSDSQVKELTEIPAGETKEENKSES
ncbi:30S ribosomal protein S16 [Candidatus Daviesbacteria bacterium]|nr:30S ribosomal protein S16 [Candidatus Daviesbacteria bacterium]